MVGDGGFAFRKLPGRAGGWGEELLREVQWDGKDSGFDAKRQQQGGGGCRQDKVETDKFRSLSRAGLRCCTPAPFWFPSREGGEEKWPAGLWEGAWTEPSEGKRQEQRKC